MVLTIGHYHDRPSPTLDTWYWPITKLRSQASLHGVNHNAPFPTALKVYLWYFFVAYFDVIVNVSAYWKHAEGMSLRLGEIVAIDCGVKMLFALSKFWWKMLNALSKITIKLLFALSKWWIGLWHKIKNGGLWRGSHFLIIEVLCILLWGSGD